MPKRAPKDHPMKSGETKTFYRFGRDRFSDSGPFTMRKVELVKIRTGWRALERISDLDYRVKIEDRWLDCAGWRETEKAARVALAESLTQRVVAAKKHFAKCEQDFAMIGEILNG